MLEGLLELDPLRRRARSPRSRARRARSRATSTTRSVRCARLAREFWGDPMLAERLEREAAELKERFNRDFWIPEREFFALALDGEKRQVDSPDVEHRPPALERHRRRRQGRGASPRTCWASALLRLGRAHDGRGRGRLQPDRVPQRHGLAARQLAHRARGSRRYGFREEAARIALALLEAATFFGHRLPEVFAGYARERHEVPGRVPDGVQPAGVGDRRAAPRRPHAARARAARRRARRRPGAAGARRAARACAGSPVAGAVPTSSPTASR